MDQPGIGKIVTISDVCHRVDVTISDPCCIILSWTARKIISRKYVWKTHGDMSSTVTYVIELI